MELMQFITDLSIGQMTLLVVEIGLCLALLWIALGFIPITETEAVSFENDLDRMT